MTRLERIGCRIGETSYAVPIVFGIYALLNLAVRLTLPTGLRIDESQQVFLSQWLSVGYDAQPPFYNWLQQAVFLLVPDPVLGLAVLKNLMLWAIFVTYHRLARVVTGDGALAAIATFALLLTPQMFWQAQRDLTHTTGTLLLTNLLLLAIANLLTAATPGRYLFLGAAMGIGMLTKYNFALALPALAAAALASPEGRARLLDRRILLSAAVAVAIFAPHGFWLLDHLDLATRSSLDKMAEAADGRSLAGQIAIGLFSLIGTGAAIMVPSAVLIALVFGRDVPRLLRASGFWSRFLGMFLLAIAVELVLIVFLTTFTSVRDRWLLPFIYVLPLYLASKASAAALDAKQALRRLLPVLAVALPLIPVAHSVAGLKAGSTHYRQPYRSFATQLTDVAAIRPSLVVAGDWHLAGNLRAVLPTVPVYSTSSPNLTPAFRWTAANPVVLVWRGDGSDMPAEYRAFLTRVLGGATDERPAVTLSLPYVGQKEQMASPFHYVVVHPR